MFASQLSELYQVPESVSFNVLLSASSFGSVKEEAEIYLKSYLQEINRNDFDLVSKLFKLYQNKCVFSSEPQPDLEMDQ